MIKINAVSKYINLTGSIKLYYTLAIGAFISILTYVLYQDLVSTLAMAGCTAVVYFIFSRPPQSIPIEISETAISIDNQPTQWSDIVGYAVVELPNMIEFVIQTTSFANQFVYFYVKPDQPGVKEFILELGTNTKYDESIPSKDLVHNLLRRVDMV